VTGVFVKFDYSVSSAPMGLGGVNTGVTNSTSDRVSIPNIIVGV